ncbi:MAG TPA: MFS transporter, partial [Planctomycetaceae bacterium]|nr:MFS transporter [Planctomycetaceae bacterium]
MNQGALDSHNSSRAAMLHLGLLFALMYFVQGLAEPTEGLIAQPVRSMLGRWDKSPGEIAHFMAIIAAPWAIKPIYGLIIDFVPLLGSRRRNYLLLATLATAISLMWLAVAMPRKGATNELLMLLFIPTLAVAFSDVVVDALMVEKGQPLGMTGRLQSIQWGSMYAATVLAGSLGGWLSENQRQELGFLICGAGAVATFFAALFWIRDTPTLSPKTPEILSSSDSAEQPDTPPTGLPDSARSRLGIMRRTLISRPFLIAAAFLFLWNFNPFCSTVQQHHMTQTLKLSEQEYGHTYSLFSLGSIGSCLIYGLLCRVIPARWLIHLAIIAGVLATLMYLLATGTRSAYAVSAIAGVAYMLGSLIQMDVAARMCPPVIAGAMFAMLMSVSNIAVILSTSLGGWLY